MHSQAPYSQAPSNGSNGSDPRAHRDANMTMQQQPDMRPPPPRGRIPALALGAYGAALLGVVLAAVSLALFLMYKSQAQAQLGQVRQDLATTQANLAKAEADNARKYTKLVGNVSGLTNAVNTYPQICSQDLTGANGPAQFWMPCSDVKP